MRAALVIALCALVAGPASANSFDSDARRLAAGLEPGFRRIEVFVYPLLDQRALADAEPGGEQAAPAAWAAFLDALRRRGNLRVRPPEQTVKSIARGKAYRVALPLLRESAETGYQLHRDVALEQAAEKLGRTFDQLVAREHHVVDPREVATAAKTRGLALLEAGRAVPASEAFRDALLVDPTLRMRRGYDRPDAVAAFEAVRAGLAAEPSEPEDFDRQTQRYVVRARALPDRLEVVIQRPDSVVRETLRFGDDAALDGSRLASRVWACLPFGRTRVRRGHRAQVHLDAGFSYFAFLESPVGHFDNVGVGINLEWLVAPHLSLDLHTMVTNSGRDEQEDLRADIPVFRANLGPAFSWSGGPVRLSAGLGIEVASVGRVVTTSNPACKFFPEQSSVPREICDFEEDIDRADSAVFVGPSLEVGVSVRLVDQIYVVARGFSTFYIFESLERGSGLELPVGGQLALGYRLF